MRSWYHNKSAIFSVNWDHCGPSATYSVDRPEREVHQVLMQRVPSRWTHIWLLVYQHCVYTLHIRSTNCGCVLDNFWMLAVGKQYFIILPVLEFSDAHLWIVLEPFFDLGNVVHDLDSKRSRYILSANIYKSLIPDIHLFLRHKGLNNKETISFILISLFLGENFVGTLIYSVLEVSGRVYLYPRGLLRGQMVWKCFQSAFHLFFLKES